MRGIKSLEYEWSTKFKEYAEPNRHMANSSFVTRGKPFGLPFYDLFVSLNMIGPAYGEARLQLHLPFIRRLDGVVLQFAKPISPMRTVFYSLIFTENTWLGYIFGKFLILVDAELVNIFRSTIQI